MLMLIILTNFLSYNVDTPTKLIKPSQLKRYLPQTIIWKKTFTKLNFLKISSKLFFLHVQDSSISFPNANSNTVLMLLLFQVSHI